MADGLLTAGGGHTWETDVVAALDRPGAPLMVVRRCADIADVLATASTGQATACLLAVDLRRLDSESVHQLRAFGVTVVAVHAAGDQWASVRLERIGVTTAVPDDAGANGIIAAVQQALAEGGAAPGIPAGPRSTADPRWALGSPGAVGPGGGPGSVGLVGRAGAGDQAGIGQGDPTGNGGPATPNDNGPSPVLPWPHSLPTGLGPGAPPGGPGAPPGRGTPPGPGPATGPSALAGPGAPAAPGMPGGQGPGTGPGQAIGDGSDRTGRGPRGAGLFRSSPSGREPMVPGTVVAVWGPGGAPGRSTVAMGLADRAAAAGRTVLLIDADVYGGILASAFGLLDESPGLAGACRLAANGRLDIAELATLCWTVGDRLALLTGIARADRWPEVRPSVVPAVLRMARQLAEVVLVDCSAVLETDEEISFDTMAPRRNGATLAVLDEADTVLAVGSADPPGMERLVRGLAELGAAVDGPAPRVVLNRVRRSAAPPGDLAATVRRFAGMDPVALLPEDRAACDRAWQRGVTLSAAAPKSTLVARLGDLAGLVMPEPAGARRSGGRSQPAPSPSAGPGGVGRGFVGGGPPATSGGDRKGPAVPP